MKRFVIALGLSAAWATACFYPASRGRALEDRATVQEQELKDMEQKLSATLPKIDEKINEVTKALEALDRAARRSDADIGVRLQKTVEDLGQLRGQVDTYLFKIGELEKGIQKLQDTIDQRFGDLQGTDAAKVASARRKFDELQKPTDKRQYLALADSKFAEGDALLSRALYDEFIKKWPKDDLTGDARFGRGETYYAEDKCREALAEYGKIIQDYPKSRSAPKAYLHSADCFSKLKMRDDARLALEEVIKSYPKSDAAKEARTRLAAMDKSKKPAPRKAKK